MILLRSALFNIAYVLWTVALGIVLLPALAAPRRTIMAIARLWARGVLALLAALVGLRHEIRGREHLPDGPVIVALKHQSAWETVAILVLLRDPAVVYKRELHRIPVFGWFLRRMGMVPIDRAAGGTAMRSLLRRARACVAEGRPIAVMPEGTRVAPGARRPYHPGIAALYKDLSLPVVPVALNAGLFWGRRTFLKRPGTITLEFLPRIEPGLARGAFMAELEQRIETASDRLAREAARTYLIPYPPAA
ncbi:MAG TPA: lysophospholipid acyltransferase family protein [Alphaproteobacteria bacterium]|jgi:1-acyl-sn-glycerol-3-phosphate acyltransferase